MPVLPFISDTEEEIDSMVKTAKNYGAHYILSTGLTLFGNDPGDCKILYFKFLKKIIQIYYLIQKNFSEDHLHLQRLSK